MQFGRLCVNMEQGYHGRCDMYIAYLQKKRKKKKKGMRMTGDIGSCVSTVPFKLLKQRHENWPH